MAPSSALHETGRLVGIALVSACAALLVAALPSVLSGTDASARAMPAPAPLLQQVDLLTASELTADRPASFLPSGVTLGPLTQSLAGLRLR